MTPYLKVALVAGLLAIGGLGGYQLRSVQAQRDAAKVEAKHSDDLRKISDTATKAANLATEWQQRANAAQAELDTRITKEKADALADNSRRAAGPERVRIAVQCPARGGDVPQTPSAASVDDGKADVTPEVRSAVFAARAALIEDTKRLEALQTYAREVCSVTP